ncbi:MAG: class I SAM-dependent methyltransferase [Candidatus Hydrogenedentota bacterium]
MSQEWKDFSKIFPRVLNKEERRIKAYKIRQIISDYTSKTSGFTPQTMIDIGCSSGIITSEIAEIFDKAIGFDVDINALRYAKDSLCRRVLWVVSNAQALPVKNNSVDLVICNHIYQYMGDPKLMMNEIERVLKPGGICYLAVANRFALFFKNYPLIGILLWLPPRLLKKIKFIFPEKFFSQKLVDRTEHLKLISGFDFTEYTIDILKRPGKYFTEIPLFYSILSKVPESILKSLIYFSFSFIWILKKKK